jgi:hypothetical protein
MRTKAIAICIGLSFSPVCPAQTDKDAQRFAENLTEIISLVSANHAKPASEFQLAQWAIHGLFRAAKQPISMKTLHRLQMLEKAHSEQRKELLHDIRVSLGRHMGLGRNKDLEICVAAIFAQLEPAAKPEERSRIYVEPLLWDAPPPRKNPKKSRLQILKHLTPRH